MPAGVPELTGVTVQSNEINKKIIPCQWLWYVPTTIGKGFLVL